MANVILVLASVFAILDGKELIALYNIYCAKINVIIREFAISKQVYVYAIKIIQELTVLNNLYNVQIIAIVKVHVIQQLVYVVAIIYILELIAQ